MTILLLLVVYSLVLTFLLRERGFSNGSVPASPAAPLRHPARVLVIGASGGTGRHVVQAALDRGHRVTAFVRHPSRLGITHANLEVRTGDVRDKQSVQEAVRGHDAVVSALGHRVYYRPTSVLSEGTRNIVTAMEQEGVKRFVCETSIGVGDSAGRLGVYYTFFVVPLILPFYYWDKALQERIVAHSGLDWTIVRPVLLTHGPATGGARASLRAGSYLFSPRISRADVASFMLDEMEQGTYVRRAVGVSL